MVSQKHRADDLDLARRCVSGDERARRELFESQRRRVHAVLYRVLGSNHDIDDAIQDAFLELYRSLAIYRGESLLSTWVDRVSVRVGIRVLRGRPAERAAMRRDAEEDTGPPLDRATEAREAVRRLYRILDDLEPFNRTAFVLHVVDGRPLRDVAEVMGATVIATKLRVWRTRRKVEAAARNDELLFPYLVR